LEFPSMILPESNDSKPKVRKQAAEAFVSKLLLGSKKSKAKPTVLKHVGELGSVPWLFSHLKLTMHVHLFSFDGGDDVDVGCGEGSRRRWLSSEDVEQESMGTGMRKCWALARK